MIHLALFDYGAGNLHSLAKGLEAGGARVTITADWDEALGRDALVLPGVGSFGAAVGAIDGHRETIRKALLDGLPCLGICLGMQLLFPGSEEGPGVGIGLIDGRVRRIRARTVPQMGWNDIDSAQAGKLDPLLDGLDAFTAYYANSYVCDADDAAVILAESEYDGEPYPAVVRKGRSWGVQFHPEKSSRAGLRILANFLREVEDPAGRR